MRKNNLMTDIEKKIGYEFRDRSLLEMALTHSSYANEKKLGIVRQYGGHGVGRQMHEEPFVFNYRVGNQFVLKKGMTIAIEPMLNLGGDDVHTLEDGWTVVTNDGKPSAHFEHTVAITSEGPVILTRPTII